jgi:RNA polymerase sigma-70 factor (ECF subfamily)
VPTEDALLDAIGVDPDHGPAQVVLTQDARAILQTAIREAIAALTSRERALLLQYYIDGVGVTELGTLFGLAASNVSRTLAKARMTLLAHVRRSVMRHRKLSGDELDSLVDLVSSQLTITGGLRAP